MATGRYRLKTNNGWDSIYFRFKEGKKFDAEHSIGIKIPFDRWSDSKQQVLATPEVDYKAVNQKLKELNVFVIGEFTSASLDSEIVNSKWVKEKISLFFNRETSNPDIDKKVFLTNFIDSFIEESKTKRSRKNTPINKRTIQHYQTTLNKIKDYEEHYGKRVKLINVDLKFHGKFIDLLENKQHLNPNTIGGYIDDIKKFCRNADKKEYPINKDYRLSEFFTTSNATSDIYLNPHEIKKIFEKKFEQDYLDNARDWLVIGLWTGLRVSDLLKLSQANVEEGFIFKTTEKTDYPAIIPIHEQVQHTLDKREGEFPRKLSDQKFNDYIKEVCKLSGLTDVVQGAKIIPIEVEQNGKKKTIHRKKSGLYKKYELVSSHTCRRSFASNLYGKIDSLTIMKITGHKTESQFLKYIKITPKEYAEKLKALWNKVDF